MQSRIDDIHRAEAEVLAVSVDPVDKNRELAGRLGLEYPLLSDADLRVIDAYGVRHEDGGPGGDIARPATFVIDREGRVAWRNLTDNSRVRPRPEHILAELGRIP